MKSRVVGTVESLWRYPVKSMRGEELKEAFVGYGGVYGDRVFAFESSTNPKGFPFFTGRDQPQIIRYRPHFRDLKKASRPINLAEARRHSPNVNPLSASSDDLMVDVETPDGKRFAIDDPRLAEHLRAKLGRNHRLTLLRSDKALTDCRPLSIIALQTIRKIGEEAGISLDQRRFRANVFVDFNSLGGFAEDQFVGKSLRIGPNVAVQVLHRDGRCVMITIDPETAEKTSAILKTVARAHEGKAGIYAAVLTQGIIRKSDPVEVIEGA